MIFADDFAAAAGLARAPVLGLFELFQAVELADFFQAFVDQLPGAWTVGADFASVFAGTAARAVHHFLGASRDGANAAGITAKAKGFHLRQGYSATRKAEAEGAVTNTQHSTFNAQLR